MEVEVNTQAKEVVFRILTLVVVEEVAVMDKEEETTISTQTINHSVSYVESLGILSIHVIIVLISPFKEVRLRETILLHIHKELYQLWLLHQAQWEIMLGT